MTYYNRNVPRSDRRATSRQLEILAIIAKHLRDEKIPPTMREIGVAAGIKSTNAINDHLRALDDKGLLGRKPLLSRGIWVTDAGARALVGLP